MNGIDKITGRIAADNNKEIQALEERTQSRVKEILAGYQSVADAQYQELLAQGEKDAATNIERKRSVADLEARKLNLAARQEMVGRAFSLAREKLLSLTPEDYTALLTDLAVDGAESGTEELIFSQKDRPIYGKAVLLAANEKLAAAGKTASLRLSEESRSFEGGLYLKNGKVEVNCTFDALLRQQQKDMAREVADILFQ